MIGNMALLFPFTTLSPTKLELIAEWLPSQPWFSGDATRLERVAEYRFDDPEGEVGLNGLLFTAGDETVYHLPLTYRDAQLDEAGDAFIGTMEHGVLGTRYVFNAIGDPVFRAVLAEVIAKGLTGAEEVTQDVDGNRGHREITVPLRGSGEPGSHVPEMWSVEVTVDDAASTASTGLATLRVIHAPATESGEDAASGAFGTLSATWPGQEEPVVIATLD